MFTFRRHPWHGAHVRHAGDTADLSHQAAERGEFQFGEIEVNSANRVNIDTAQVNTTQHQQIEQFTSQTETVFTKDFKTHGSVHPKSANDGRIIGREWVFSQLSTIIDSVAEKWALWRKVRRSVVKSPAVRPVSLGSGVESRQPLTVLSDHLIQRQFELLAADDQRIQHQSTPCGVAVAGERGLDSQPFK